MPHSITSSKRTSNERLCYNAFYDVEFSEGRTMKLRKESWVCLPCRTENWIGIHRVKQGNIFVCRSCRHRMRVDHHLFDIDPVPPNS